MHTRRPSRRGPHQARFWLEGVEMPSSWAAGSKPAAACFEPARLSKLASSHHSYLFSVQGDTAGGRLTEAEFRPAGLAGRLLLREANEAEFSPSP